MAKIQAPGRVVDELPAPSGPITIAIPAHAVHVPIAAPRSSAGNVAVMTDTMTARAPRPDALRPRGRRRASRPSARRAHSSE